MGKIQTSESVRIGIMLALSGGFMDAYSYIVRGKVFANAQTGNLLLLGVGIYEGHLSSVIRYGLPVVAFSLGIILSDVIRVMLMNNENKKNNLLHWRQICVLFEILFLILVCFVPENLNLLANSVTSFVCGIQVETFRKIHGNGIATTMCIGNLRSGAENLVKGITNNNKRLVKKAILYYCIIICFVLGAVLGDFMISILKEKSLLVCSVILSIVFIMMFWEEKELKIDLR